MPSSNKHLVMLGTGRAHLNVLKGLSHQSAGGVSVTMVASNPWYIEPTMLPGYVAGAYEAEDISAPLDALVEASGTRFVPAQVQSLDLDARRVHLSNGDALPFDVLSVDVEPGTDRDQIDAHIPGARDNALSIHPNQNFMQLWPQLVALAQQRPLQVAVLADDLAGVELAMTAAQTLAAPHGSRVTLVCGDLPMLGEPSSALQRRLRAHLDKLDVTILAAHCTGMTPGAIQLSNGATLQCDAPILAHGMTQPDWLLNSGLQRTETGELQINERLQSDSHRQIFIVPVDAPPEVGATLETNLRTALGGGSFKKAPLQAKRLQTFTCGNGQAIACWGPLGWEGREVWNWRNRRDRRQLASLFQV